MGFEMRKKGKFKKAEEFMTRMKEVHEEAEAALKKSQEEMKKYTNRKRKEVEEYQVEDWVPPEHKRSEISNERKTVGKLIK